MVSLHVSPHLGQNSPSTELFSQKIILFYYQTFFLFQTINYVLCLIVLSKYMYLKKKSGSPCSFKRKGALFYFAIELSLREIF